MKRLSLTELVLLPVGLAALNTSWLALWVRWITAAGDLGAEPGVSPLLMLITLLTGVFITRWAVAAAQNNLELQKPQRLIGFSGLAAVISLLWLTFGERFPVDYVRNFTEWGRLISAEALALGVAVWLWWRAIRIGRDDDLHNSARREFSGGVLALALLFVCNKIDPQLATADAFWPTLLFFVIGLGALALAGFEQDRRIQTAGTGMGLGLSRGWLGTVGAVIGCIIAGATLVIVLVSPDSIAGLDGLLDAVGVILINGVGLVVYLIAVALLPLAEGLVRALLPLLHLLVGLSASFKLNLNAPTPQQIDALARQLARTPTFRVIEILVILGLVLIIFMAAVRRFRLLAGGQGDDEIHESIFSRELLWNQLKTLFARRPAGAPAGPPPYLNLDGLPDDPRLIVRRAYQRLLHWAAAIGQPRPPDQTPRTYARTLGSAVPAESAAITLLTEVYIRARYGGEISTDDARRAQEIARQLTGSGAPGAGQLSTTTGG